MGSYRIQSGKLQFQVSALARKAAARAADRLMLRGKIEVLQAGRVQTGGMANAFEKKNVTGNPKKPTYRVSNSSKHFRFQNDGTGTPPGIGKIFPKRGKALVFVVGGRKVFARSVRGVKPGRFMQKAAAQMRTSDFT